jgi:hypothetical protein
MNLTEEQIDKLLSDVGTYKDLLKWWITVWDVIEEYVQNDTFSFEQGNKLYEITKAELSNKNIGPATPLLKGNK